MTQLGSLRVIKISVCKTMTKLSIITVTTASNTRMMMKSRMMRSKCSQLITLVLIDPRSILQASFCPRSVPSERKSFGPSMQTTPSWSTPSTSPIRTNQLQISNSSKSSSHGSATTFTTYTTVCVEHTLWLPAILVQSCISTDNLSNRLLSSSSHKMMKSHRSQVASTRVIPIQRITESTLGRSADQRIHPRQPMTPSSSNNRLMPTGHCLHSESPQ